MNPLTLEWVDKADGDYDAVCFHAQQCAEKYLKAILQEAALPFGKTHNLINLLDLLLVIDPSWEALRLDLQQLALFAVYVRYPGARADKLAARQALTLARQVRSRARTHLGFHG